MEYRKIAKQFLDFIKSGQRFYRGYIQSLATRFEGVKELDAVANILTLSSNLSSLTTHACEADWLMCSSRNRQS